MRVATTLLAGPILLRACGPTHPGTAMQPRSLSLRKTLRFLPR